MIARIQQEQALSVDGHPRFPRQIVAGPASRELESQAAVLQRELESRGQRQLTFFLPVVTKDAAALRHDHPPATDQVRAEILAVPDKASRR